MRRRVLLSLTLVALSACNGDKAVRPSEATSPTSDISDATHSGGGMTSNPDFFFLPPMVGNPSGSTFWDNGAFNPDLLPRVDICSVGTGTPDTQEGLNSNCTTSVASLAATVDPGTEQYKVNWTVPNSATTFYRIKVIVGTTLLGLADVQTASNTSQLKNVQTNQLIPLQDGRTLPIKFRIERYALCEIPGKGPCATKAVDIAGVGGTVATPLVDNSAAENGAVFAPASATTTTRPTVTVERCVDFRQRGITDLPTFGPCVRVRVEPALTSPLQKPVMVFSCDVSESTVAPQVYSAAQAERVTLHRYKNGRLEALPHEHPDCTQSSAAAPSMSRVFAALRNGQIRAAATQMLGLLAPQPLYAARYIDLGGGGFSFLNDGGSGGASLNPTNGARLSVSSTTTDDRSVHEFQFILPAKFDYITTPTARAAYPADVLAVTVQVTDLGGQPVANALVHFSAADGGTVSKTSAATGADGTAALDWTVTALSPNTFTATGVGLAGEDLHGPRDRTRTPNTIDPFVPCDSHWEVVTNPFACTMDGKPVTVGAGSMKVTAITVGKIGGRVVDEQTGAPVAATVGWSPSTPVGSQSTSGGAFLIENLTPGPRSALVHYGLTFSASNYLTYNRNGVGVQPKATTDLGDVCLRPAPGDVKGTAITTLDNSLIQPDLVTVTATPVSVATASQCTSTDLPALPSNYQTTTTTGSFLLKGLAPGTYRLTVHSEDYDDPSPVEDVVVTSAGVKDQGAIALRWKFGQLSGVVVSRADGSPISGAVVAGGPAPLSTLPDGSFFLTKVPPANYALSITAPGYVAGTANALVTKSSRAIVGPIQLDPMTVSASASVSPDSYTGSCAAATRFSFSGSITSSAAGTVTYIWERSDGGFDTLGPYTLTFDAPGTLATVPKTWDRSVTGTGWERIKITSPNGVTSNDASFTQTCTSP